jgi:hypothetical protein
MSGMMIVALGNSYIVLLGIQAAGTQARSTKAYFVAEAGAERLLWEIRKNQYKLPKRPLGTPICTSGTACTSFGNQTIIDTDGPDYLGSIYQVYFTSFPVLTFKAVGTYLNTSRSIEIKT